MVQHTCAVLVTHGRPCESPAGHSGSQSFFHKAWLLMFTDMEMSCVVRSSLHIAEPRSTHTHTTLAWPFIHALCQSVTHPCVLEQPFLPVPGFCFFIALDESCLHTLTFPPSQWSAVSHPAVCPEHRTGVQKHMAE